MADVAGVINGDQSRTNLRTYNKEWKRKVSHPLRDYFLPKYFLNVVLLFVKK